MLSEVPEGWAVEELGNVLSVLKNGYSCKQIKAPIDGYVPVSRIETISGGYINNKKVGFVPYEEKLEDFRIFKGDILFSHINSIEHVGKIAFSDSDQKIYHAMNLLLMRPDKSKVQPNYLAEVLRWDITREYFREHSKRAVNQVSLNQKNISAYEFALPPLTEQKRIAEVLSSVDESIQATQRLIEQAERVKEVFASSVVSGDNPNFRSVKFGPITELCDINPRQKMVKGETYAFVDMASLPIKNSLEIKYARKELGSGGAKFQNGDTLFARITPCTENGKLGYVSELKQNELAFGSTEFTVLRPRFSASKLVYIYCYAGVLREHLITRMVGSTGRQRVPNEAFSELDIAFYDEKSQQAIIAVFDELERTQYENKELLSALEKTKKGLMDDLLTGQVRTV